MKLRAQRLYEEASAKDGKRVLVDRLWPRGVSKEKLRVDYWAKDVAPSTELRRWYGHEPEKWAEFKRRYFAELDANVSGVEALHKELGRGVTTLLFSSKEERLNNAHALIEYLTGKG